MSVCELSGGDGDGNGDGDEDDDDDWSVGAAKVALSGAHMGVAHTRLGTSGLPRSSSVLPQTTL